MGRNTSTTPRRMRPRGTCRQRWAGQAGVRRCLRCGAAGGEGCFIGEKLGCCESVHKGLSCLPGQEQVVGLCEWAFLDLLLACIK